MNQEQQEARALQKALALTLKRLRERKGIAQEALAIESRAGRSHLSAMERGYGNPTLTTIAKLLPYLGVNFAQFGAELDRHFRIRLR